MIDARDKLTIRVTRTGVALSNAEGLEMHFSASEALMLLDILKNEEDSLIKMATEASPLPTRICMSSTSRRDS